MFSKTVYAMALTFVTASLVPRLGAQQMSQEEVRTEYLRLADALAARVPASDQSSWAVGIRQKISDFRSQVNALSIQSLDQLGKASDRQTFDNMVDRLNASNANLPANSVGGKASVIRPQLAIQPPDFSGAVAGTTCTTTPTDAGTLDGEHIGLDVAVGVQVPLDYACETIVEVLGEGTNAPFCIAAAVAKAAEVILQSILEHQEFCNSLLDGAKADAALADVEDIHADLDNVDAHITNVDNHISAGFAAAAVQLTNVDAHIANEFLALDAHLVTLVNQLSTQLTGATDLLSADLRQVMKLELTPNGQKAIVPAILTCTGTDCPNVLNKCPNGMCSWNNVGPLP